ncbi:phosphate ABC transporter substrate-binding protein, PhoT family [Syntrophobotulus glycolicus DSM 8271]|uniref:Phosphate-binding protein n=1 Tax=Syntrophobotulus glycolicus (strain DSM 8271 / FlGlyR) TaxID=645991 RepID=F0SVM5_SYNGF|nr:phosphate ABC transporter substrate-binding protein [Syntrophobotulus glycolicus]ADY54501.1 phosphate ABC transporter substrate-binding protein, PhoT family [Syntrophobotulus glycolicus DSM 8271]
MSKSPAKNRIYLFIVSLLLIASVAVTGCGKGAGTEADSSKEELSGSITAVGSSALQPLAEKAAQDFMAKNPQAKVQVQGGGSGVGLTQAFQGAAHIGNSDIFADEKLKPEEAATLVDHKVAVVGFATVVNPQVSVDNLTQQQLVDIFTGKITNWNEVGGQDLKVVIINRPTSSGTRASFKKYGLNGAEEAAGKALTEDSSGTVKKTVADTPGAISYLALSYINDNTVKPLKYGGVEPTAENIAAGTYPIWSYEHMYTKGEATGLTKAYIDYILSPDVQNSVVKSLKFIPITDMKASR